MIEQDFFQITVHNKMLAKDYCAYFLQLPTVEELVECITATGLAGPHLEVVKLTELIEYGKVIPIPEPGKAAKFEFTLAGVYCGYIQVQSLTVNARDEARVLEQLIA